MSALLDHPAGPDRSVAQAVAGEDEAARAAATGLTRLTLGEEPDRVSAADYDQLWSGDDIWVDGYGAVVAGHYADLAVRLDTPVTALDWSGPGVTVETPRGTLRGGLRHRDGAGRVLASGALRITPALPAATAEAVAGLTMGAYTKIGLALDLARLKAQDLRDAVILRSGMPGLTAYLEMQPFGKPLAVLHCGGDGARAVCEAGERAALAAATDHLASVFGADIRAAVTGRAPRRLVDRFVRPRQLFPGAAGPSRRPRGPAPAGGRADLPRRRGRGGRRGDDGGRGDARRRAGGAGRAQAAGLVRLNAASAAAPPPAGAPRPGPGCRRRRRRTGGCSGRRRSARSPRSRWPSGRRPAPRRSRR